MMRPDRTLVDDAVVDDATVDDVVVNPAGDDAAVDNVAVDDAVAVVRRLRAAHVLAAGTAADERGWSGESTHGPLAGDADLAAPPGGTRWRLGLPAAMALTGIVLGLGGAAWWWSRPVPVAEVYDGAAPSTDEQLAAGEASDAPSSDISAGGVTRADPSPTDIPAADLPPADGVQGDPSAAVGAGFEHGVGSTIEVHVVGAVRHPGLVTVAYGARAADAVAAAGGLARRADQRAINLARVVADGEQVNVPRRGDGSVPLTQGTMAANAGASPDVAGSGVGASSSGGSLDLNSTDATGLEALPGIGPALAGRILTWRGEHGPFVTVDQLLEVSGIGEATLANLRDLVTVG